MNYREMYDYYQHLENQAMLFADKLPFPSYIVSREFAIWDYGIVVNLYDNDDDLRCRVIFHMNVNGEIDFKKVEIEFDNPLISV